jgi:hypothetical protein
LRISGCEKAASDARGAVSVIVGMMKRGARFLDVRARVRSLRSLEKRGEGEQKLGDREKEKRGSPQCSWKDA